MLLVFAGLGLRQQHHDFITTVANGETRPLRTALSRHLPVAPDIFGEKPAHTCVLHASLPLCCMHVADHGGGPADRTAQLSSIARLLSDVLDGSLTLHARIGQLASQKHLVAYRGHTQHQRVLMSRFTHQQLALSQEVRKHPQMPWRGLHDLLRQPRVALPQLINREPVLFAAQGAAAF
ncbi:hypothetical protein [Aquabacterium sp.]|uniref:hypothetical protein n=1 Tax=Aquabacterium sp. TaxID=1872578 RepID=UPI0025BC491E|nr:hypothetical protein [Aquabacterium sp.]